MSRTILVCALVLFIPITALAQEADLPPCPAVVDIPTAAIVAGFRACGEEGLAADSERQIRTLRGRAEPTVVAAPVAVVVPPVPSVVEAPVVAPVPPPVAATPTPVAAPTAPRLPYIGEASARMSGSGVPLVTSFPGFLHRRPAPWSERRGLRLWNGLNCDGDFAFAIEVRVDGRVVVPTEMGAAWPPIPVVDSAGRRSTAYLIPQGRDRRTGGYVYVPVGGGDHDVEVTMYDAPLGMTPMRIGGGRFRFNPSTSGDLHSLQWHDVDPEERIACPGR